MTVDMFINELEKIGISLTKDQLNKFSIYANFLKDYNTHTNLTSITDIDQIYLKHFFDSITIIKELDITSIKNVLDIGTGAGFPGMVLKIVFPHLSVTLLDSNNKKTTFLKELAAKISVDNVTVIHSRVEDFAKTNSDKFDLVTSRAVANLIILSELALPLVKVKGHFIALKGDLNKEEDAQYAIETLGGKILNINKFLLPIEKSVRTIVNVQKISATPTIYPRSYDKILKKPLKKKVK